MEAIEEDTVRLQGGTVLSHEQVKSWLRLSYAQTYASCQGSEFEDTLRLHADTPQITIRHLNVGLSRAREAALVSVI